MEVQIVKFFVVGAAKSGTTTVFNSLLKTNMFSLPLEKEPNRFNIGCSLVPGTGPGDKYATTVLRDEKQYQKNFRGKSSVGAVDFSVAYLYDDMAPIEIFRHNEDAKILIILRNPVDRAYSHYLHMVRDCRETLSFEDALESEEERKKLGYEFSWHYKTMGLYCAQVQRYLELFGENNVLVVKFEDLLSDKQKVEECLNTFFEVPHGTISLTSEKFNATGTVKNKYMASFVNKPSRLRNFIKNLIPRDAGRYLMNKLRSANLKDVKPNLSIETKIMLVDYYREDISELSRLTNKNFNDWLRI